MESFLEWKKADDLITAALDPKSKKVKLCPREKSNNA
jgi:hypothetical protein